MKKRIPVENTEQLDDASVAELDEATPPVFVDFDSDEDDQRPSESGPRE